MKQDEPGAGKETRASWDEIFMSLDALQIQIFIEILAAGKPNDLIY